MHFKIDLQTQFLFILHCFKTIMLYIISEAAVLNFLLFGHSRKQAFFLGKKAHLKKSDSRKYI